LTTGVLAAIQLNATDDFDVGTMHDPVTNNTRITIPSSGDGVYLVGGQVTFDSNATNERRVNITVGGAVTIAEHRGAAVTNALMLTISTLYPLIATNYIEINATQTSGGNLSVLSANMWAIWMAF